MPDSIPIRNPYAGHGEYHCFGCDPDNPVGLKLAFRLENSSEGERVVATWEPRQDLEGYPGVVHGGIQATLCDEVAAWFVYAVHGRAGVTRRLTVDYLTPARLDQGPLEVSAHLVGSTAKSAQVEVTITDHSDTLCARADVEFAVFGDEVGRRRFSYPGREAFL